MARVDERQMLLSSAEWPTARVGSGSEAAWAAVPVTGGRIDLVASERRLARPGSWGTGAMASGGRVGVIPSPRSSCAGIGRQTGRLRLTRRGRLVRTAAIFLVALLGTLLLGVANSDRIEAAESSAGTAPVVAYVVKSGDTLWGVARRLDPHVDPRIMVDRLVELNAITASRIVPGQLLVVPA